MDQAQNLRNVIKVKNQSRKLDARVITVTSGKGGVGKSNVAVNLAVQISKMGKKVLIFDADLVLPMLKLCLAQFHVIIWEIFCSREKA